MSESLDDEANRILEQIRKSAKTAKSSVSSTKKVFTIEDANKVFFGTPEVSQTQEVDSSEIF